MYPTALGRSEEGEGGTGQGQAGKDEEAPSTGEETSAEKRSILPGHPCVLSVPGPCSLRLQVQS